MWLSVTIVVVRNCIKPFEQVYYIYNSNIYRKIYYSTI